MNIQINPAPRNTTQDRDARGIERDTTDPSEVIISRELTGIISRFKSALPFLALILVRFLFQHALKLTFFVGSAVVLYRMSDGLREQIALKSLSSRKVLFGLLCLCISLLLSIFFSMSIFGDNKLWLRLVLLRKDEPNLGLLDILWFAVVTDLAARTAITAVKIAACIWLPSSTGRSQEYVRYLSAMFFHVRHRVFGIGSDGSSVVAISGMDVENGPYNEPRNRRSGQHGTHSNSQDISDLHGTSELGSDDVGIERSVEIALYMRKKRFCLVIDAAGTIWRSILPVPLWLNFFLQGPGSDVFPVAYLCFKMMSASWQAKALFELVGSVLVGKLEYGHYATAEELANMGNSDCSVCFEKHYRPVSLACRHVFCEHCIYEWLDRERTCPVCRAEVREEQGTSAGREGDAASSLPVLI